MALKFQRVRGDAISMRAAAFGTGSREARDDDYSRLQEFTRNLRDRSRGFVEQTREILDVFYSDETREMVRDSVATLTGVYRRNMIAFLRDYTDIGTAPEVQRRYIVAHHRLREFVRDQRCDAYGQKWNLPERKEEDVYYRAMRNGLVEVPTDETERCYSDFEYGLQDELREAGADPLLLGEQLDGVATWAVMDHLMDLGIDPTSKSGELL